jgi:arabinose-5-phosphate isomerase
MVLLEARNFTREDYGMRHPGGAIGRAVTLRIGDLMRTGEHVAIVSPDDEVKSALLKMTSARCGCAIVADSERNLLGIFTDGDFRRRIDSDLSILSRKVSEVMTPHPECVRQDALAIEALRILERRHIDDIIVVDDGRKVVGLIDIQDLPRFKIM